MTLVPHECPSIKGENLVTEPEPHYDTLNIEAIDTMAPVQRSSLNFQEGASQSSNRAVSNFLPLTDLEKIVSTTTEPIRNTSNPKSASYRTLARKLSCKHCFKTFKRGCDLKRHSVEKKFKCADCYRSFKRKDTLTRHVSRFHMIVKDIELSTK